MSEFAQIQRKVMKVIIDDLKAERLNLAEFSTILWLLKHAEDQAEIYSILSMYEDDFSSFKHILSEEEAASREKEEVDIQNLVARMIKENPAQAKEFAEFAMNDDANIDELLAKFPDAKKYL